MPNYLSRMKPNGANGTEYKLKDEELREAFDVFKEDIKGTQTATGNPITLTDGSETYAQGLSVELEPKQDLHGQDAPYVGGAGKNKLPMTVDGIKAANTDGTWSGNVYSINNGTFTILTDDGGNVTGIKVNGTFNANTNFFIGEYSLSGSYIISGCPSGGSTSTYYMNSKGNGYWEYKETGNGISFSGALTGTAISVANGMAVNNLTFLPMIRLSTENDPTFAPWSNICPISGYEGVEVTTADSDTDPTQSRTASVTFGQTVMGGKVNVTDGGTDKLYNVVVVDGSYDIVPGAYNMPFMLNLPNDIKASTSSSELSGVLCIMMHEVTQASSWGTPCTFSRTTNERGTIFFKMQDELTDIDELKTYLNANPLYFVYPIDTPTTLATPKTDLKLLQDTNNITTNGTTITLDYIPNNSIGDAVKASEEYTDRAVERAIPKSTFIDTWMISEESDTISVDLTSYDCNFFLLEYLFMSKRGTTLIPRPQGGSFSASVVTYNNGSAYYVELTYNPTTKELSYTSNITSQFGILAIYTI